MESEIDEGYKPKGWNTKTTWSVHMGEWTTRQKTMNLSLMGLNLTTGRSMYIGNPGPRETSTSPTSSHMYECESRNGGTLEPRELEHETQGLNQPKDEPN